mgnify:CR=1 FL=1
MFLLLFAFGAKNQDVITVDYLVAQVQLETSTVMSLTFFMGFALAWLFAFFYVVRLKLKLAQMQSALKKMNSSVSLPTAHASQLTSAAKE